MFLRELLHWALKGVGNQQKERYQRGQSVYAVMHLYRRLTDAEAALTGPRDIRGTEEARRRLNAMALVHNVKPEVLMDW